MYCRACITTLAQNTSKQERRSWNASCRMSSRLMEPPYHWLFDRLGLGVLQDFSKLRADTQTKNIAAWTPVVAEIFQGFIRFDDKDVSYGQLSCYLQSDADVSLSSQHTYLSYIRWPRISWRGTLHRRFDRDFVIISCASGIYRAS